MFDCQLMDLVALDPALEGFPVVKDAITALLGGKRTGRVEAMQTLVEAAKKRKYKINDAVFKRVLAYHKRRRADPALDLLTTEWLCFVYEPYLHYPRKVIEDGCFKWLDTHAAPFVELYKRDAGCVFHEIWLKMVHRVCFQIGKRRLKPSSFLKDVMDIICNEAICRQDSQAWTFFDRRFMDICRDLSYHCDPSDRVRVWKQIWCKFFELPRSVADKEFEIYPHDVLFAETGIFIQSCEMWRPLWDAAHGVCVTFTETVIKYLDKVCWKHINADMSRWHCRVAAHVLKSSVTLDLACKVLRQDAAELSLMCTRGRAQHGTREAAFATFVCDLPKELSLYVCCLVVCSPQLPLFDDFRMAEKRLYSQ